MNIYLLGIFQLSPRMIQMVPFSLWCFWKQIITSNFSLVSLDNSNKRIVQTCRSGHRKAHAYWRSMQVFKEKKVFEKHRSYNIDQKRNVPNGFDNLCIIQSSVALRISLREELEAYECRIIDLIDTLTDPVLLSESECIRPRFHRNSELS